MRMASEHCTGFDHTSAVFEASEIRRPYESIRGREYMGPSSNLAVGEYVEGMQHGHVFSKHCLHIVSPTAAKNVQGPVFRTMVSTSSPPPATGPVAWFRMMWVAGRVNGRRVRTTAVAGEGCASNIDAIRGSTANSRF